MPPWLREKQIKWKDKEARINKRKAKMAESFTKKKDYGFSFKL